MSSTPQLILTGGSSVIARGIIEFWTQTLPSWSILFPSHGELDVTESKSVDDYFLHHSCDLLVCCAGYSENQLLLKTSIESWEKSISINLTGAARCAKAAAKQMRRKGNGHIVFISSYSALHPPIGHAAYASAKAGLMGLSKSLAREWGQFNIRVNTILPGWIPSPMTNAVSSKRHNEVIEEHSLGRFNSTQAVAAFLITLQTQLIHTSGQLFVLDSRIS